MKNEFKRYMLVEYADIEERFYDTEEEYKTMLININKYNNRKSEKYIFGNISYTIMEDGRLHVVIHRYHKLTPKMCITMLDDLTSEMNESELVSYFSDKLITKINEGYEPDINIAYFEDKNKKDKTSDDVDRRIKYIPVLYKDDLIYLDKKYIFNCMAYYLKEKNLDFFLDLAKEFDCHRDVSEQIEALRLSIDRVKYGNFDDIVVYRAAKELYEALIVERNDTTRVVRDKDGNIQKSRRRQRDFGFFIRDYGMKSSKRNSPLRYNKKLKAQDTYKYDEDENIQEEYALMSWDQDNGVIYDDYFIEYDSSSMKFVRK